MRFESTIISKAQVISAAAMGVKTGWTYTPATLRAGFDRVAKNVVVSLGKTMRSLGKLYNLPETHYPHL